jgi:hypothetical protein
MPRLTTHTHAYNMYNLYKAAYSYSNDRDNNPEARVAWLSILPTENPREQSVVSLSVCESIFASVL